MASAPAGREEMLLQQTRTQYQAALERMRKEHAARVARNAQLEAELHTARTMLAPPKALNPRALLEMDRAMLLEFNGNMARKQRLFEERNSELLQRIQRLQNDLIQHHEVESRIVALQRAAAAQTAVQKALEGQLGDAAALKATCRRQEQAIAALERLVQTNALQRDMSVHSALQPPIPSPVYTLLQEEVKTLTEALAVAQEVQGEETLESVRMRIREEEARIAALEAQHRSTATPPGIDDAVLAVSVAAAEKEAQELQQQLLSMARRHAQELTDMEIRIMEAEAKAQGGFGAPSSLALNELPHASPFAARRPPSMPSPGSQRGRRPESGVRLQPL